MGVRVHKLVGYGLSDVVENDSRINWAFKNSYPQFIDYVEWINNQGLSIDDDMPMMVGWEPRDSVTYNSEYGLKNVFLIQTPTERKRWYRYADLIDTIEEMHRYTQGLSINYFRELDEGIQPYQSMWMNVKPEPR